MNMKKQKLFNSFVNACNGFLHFLAYDRNGKIHFVAAILVSFSGFYFKVSLNEWYILMICFAMVISFEMCNHALEKLSDAVQATHHPLIKTVKDVAAAAVLWSAIISAVIGLLIFVPKIAAII